MRPESITLTDLSEKEAIIRLLWASTAHHYHDNDAVADALGIGLDLIHLPEDELAAIFLVRVATLKRMAKFPDSPKEQQ